MSNTSQYVWDISQDTWDILDGPQKGSQQVLGHLVYHDPYASPLWDVPSILGNLDLDSLPQESQVFWET